MFFLLSLWYARKPDDPLVHDTDICCFLMVFVFFSFFLWDPYGSSAWKAPQVTYSPIPAQSMFSHEVRLYISQGFYSAVIKNPRIELVLTSLGNLFQNLTISSSSLNPGGNALVSACVLSLMYHHTLLWTDSIFATAFLQKAAIRPLEVTSSSG